MTEQERLNRIKELLAKRNEHIDAEGQVTDYMKYDEPIQTLNDEGHIDWLVQRIIILEQRNKRIADTALEQIDVTQARNERLEKRVQELEERIERETFISSLYEIENQRYKQELKDIITFALNHDAEEQAIQPSEIIEMINEDLKGDSDA